MAALNNAIVQNRAIPKNAARHPLVKNGNVRPVMLQPLFKEIDELDYGGRILFSSLLSTEIQISIQDQQPIAFSECLSRPITDKNFRM